VDPKSEVSNVVNSDRVGAVFQPASVGSMPVTVHNHPVPEIKVGHGLVVVNRLLGVAFLLVLILLLVVVSPGRSGRQSGAPAALSPTSTTVPPSTTTRSPAAPVLGVVPPVPSATPPGPRIEIAVGAPTGSARCESPSCHWIDTRLSGFPPIARIEVVAIGDGRDFSEPCVTTADANGAAVCGDTRYDVPGAQVYAYVDLGDTRITSNTLTWPES
jgi:hypothetical protein